MTLRSLTDATKEGDLEQIEKAKGEFAIPYFVLVVRDGYGGELALSLG